MLLPSSKTVTAELQGRLIDSALIVDPAHNGWRGSPGWMMKCGWAESGTAAEAAAKSSKAEGGVNDGILGSWCWRKWQIWKKLNKLKNLQSLQKLSLLTKTLFSWYFLSVCSAYPFAALHRGDSGFNICSINFSPHLSLRSEHLQLHIDDWKHCLDPRISLAH